MLSGKRALCPIWGGIRCYMVLTELRPLSGDKFTAVFDGGETVRVSTIQVADFSLYSGREMTGEEYAALQAAARLFACRERALRIIGARAMSCKELYDRLTDKGESPENAESCVEWLMELHYLDDAQYAAMLVRHYAAKGYGQGKIKNELYRRGVSKTLWDEALEEMPESGDKVLELLMKRLKSPDPDRAEMKKATDALFRRGFSWDEIKAAVSKFDDEYREN